MACEEIISKYPWLNNELFETILSKCDQQIRVDRFDVQSALDSGENYSSYLIRTNVQYSDNDQCKSIQLIIKATLDNLVRSRNVFAKEIFIYENVIPKIENALQAANIPTKLTPKYFNGDLQKSYLILEDLTAAQYINIPRAEGLNFSQMQLCLDTLALWHAASVKILGDKTPEFYEFFKPHVSPNGSPMYKTLFENAVDGCYEAFKNHHDFKEISHKLRQLSGNVFSKCCTFVERNDNGVNVLNHGDLWSNNIMFALDKTTRPLFLDFQMSNYGSPILDVSYLLFTSSNENITSTEFDKLIDYYCDQLIAAMQKLNVPNIPTKQELDKEFSARGGYGAILSLFSVPLRILKPANNNGVKLFLDKTDEGKTFRSKIYSCPNAQKILSNLLIYFNKMNFLQ